MKYSEVDRSLCSRLAVGVFLLAFPLAGCGSSQMIGTDTTAIGKTYEVEPKTGKNREVKKEVAQ